ncbi:MAG: DUF3093 domain-containing protein [Actinobacteria bacterium]|nr:DUF3093 domain-containing protein [Actinomycetota bacterium]
MELNHPPSVTYSETVRPPAWLLAFLLFLTESVALSVWAAFDNRTGVFAFVIALLIVVASAFALSLQIEVTEDELRVGRAHIERRYLGEVTELEANAMARVRGRDADPAAYLALRFWQPRGIKVEVRDDRDPSPYWLITTKKPIELSQALRQS